MKRLLRPGSDGACLCPDQYPTEVPADCGGQTTDAPYEYFWADLYIAEIESEYPRRPGFQWMLDRARERLAFIRRQFAK